MPYRWDRKAAAAGEYHLAAGTGAYSLALCTPFLNHSTYDPGSDVALIGSWVGGETGAKRCSLHAFEVGGHPTADGSR